MPETRHDGARRARGRRVCDALADPAFHAELQGLLRDYVGRATPLYLAERLTAHVGGARIFLKREDLAHTGAHKINNALGQALIARRLGKQRIVAETGAGQHGVAWPPSARASASTASSTWARRTCGARPQCHAHAPPRCRPSSPSRRARHAQGGHERGHPRLDRDVETTHYLIGSAAGPHPYPTLVRELQSVIGREARAQLLAHPAACPTP